MRYVSTSEQEFFMQINYFYILMDREAGLFKFEDEVLEEGGLEDLADEFEEMLDYSKAMLQQIKEETK